jgi:hypothetical protein
VRSVKPSSSAAARNPARSLANGPGGRCRQKTDSLRRIR